MTTVYPLKQMIRLWSASSSWNTSERFLFKPRRGPAHAAGSPPRCWHSGRASADDTSPEVHPCPWSPQRPNDTSPQEGWHKQGPRLQTNHHFSWSPKPPRTFQESLLSVGKHLSTAASAAIRQAGAWCWVVMAGSMRPQAGTSLLQARGWWLRKGRGKNISHQATNYTPGSQANSKKHWSIKRLWSTIFFLLVTM